VAYEAWCHRKGRRAYPDDEFAVRLRKLCMDCGIPVKEQAGCAYLVNVRLVPLLAIQKGEHDASSSPAPSAGSKTPDESAYARLLPQSAD
jgi:hypothetical protein